MIEKIEFDNSKLKGKIVEVCGTQDEFSKRAGISRKSVSLKMNCKREFTRSEIIRTCKVLNINKEEIGSYFFEPRVTKA